MTNEEIRNLAEEKGYQYVELTTGVNGYPRNLHPVIVDFTSYADAFDFAHENGGEVIWIRKKNGWQLWESHGLALDDIDLAEVYAEDSIFYRNRPEDYESEKDFLDEISYLFEDCKTFAEYREILDEYEQLWEDLQELDADEILIHSTPKYNEKLKRYVSEYEYDSSLYKIAVEL